MTTGPIRKRGRPRNVTGKRSYATLGQLFVDMADALRPPERMTVSDAAGKYRWFNTPGKPAGPWKREETPYLIEPQDLLTDRNYGAVVFAGPAQTGKTEVWLNWLAYSVVCDPMDMILYQTTNTQARDFSKRRVDRMHRDCQEVGDRLLNTGDADNVFDKTYRSGMIASLSWPAIGELSGRPIGRVALTDYDRMPMNVDGEGSPFDLARKRSTSFGSAAKTFAESSPGFVVEDLRWLHRSKHEAPPCKGILALYNRGDRRRWYWECIHCRHWYEPSFERLVWPATSDPVEAGEATEMQCPHCMKMTPPSKKYELNLDGVWVKDGMILLPGRKLEGKPFPSDIASFWLKGPAAAYASWASLVQRYLIAEAEFERTGSQEALKSTVNTDQGEAYYPRGLGSDRAPDTLKQLAEDELPKQQVPEHVRFLVALADTQKNMWSAQVFGIGPGENAPFDITVIDRLEIKKSHRVDDDGERLWVKPGAHLEDWDLLLEELIEREYPLVNGLGHMKVLFVGCDSGGREGVTTNAYNFWRKLRRAGKHHNFFLMKGDNAPGAPRAKISYPDSPRKDRHAGARGEIPILMTNPNILKDQLNNMLERAGKEGGLFRFPSWLPDAFFTELCSEQRTPKGWEDPRNGRRNEAWDLSYMCLGICALKKIEKMNWNEPPDWAAEWPKNSRVRMASKEAESEQFAQAKAQTYSLAHLAGQLA